MARLTVFLVLLGIAQVFALEAYSQSTKLTLKYSDIELERVLKEIEKESGFFFLYNKDLIDVEQKVEVDFEEKNITEILDVLLAGKDIRYYVFDRQIVLSNQFNEEDARATNNLQQQTPVSGKVTDSFGLPLPGVTVIIKGTTQGTVTNADGNYSLSNIPENAALVFSFIGMRTQEIVVGNQTTININMQEETIGIEEVVAVGYGIQKKRDLTGAIGSVKMDDVPVATVSTVSHALAGSVAGLQVNLQSAQPGGDVTFNIRGAAGGGAGNNPLIVIDGFPVNREGEPGSGNRYQGGSKDFILSSLNPNDIESIEIFKDASATAIYGSRAGHGVIYITTKRGKIGHPVIKYSANTAMQKMPDIYRMLNAADFMRENNKYAYERFMIENRITPYGNRTFSDFPENWYTPVYSDEQINNPSHNTDWLDAITRTGLQQQHNLSLNGGTESTMYQASLGYFDQAGVIKNNDMQRFSSRLNLDQKISDYFKTGISILINQNKFNNIPLGDGANEYAGIIRSATQFTPLMPIKDDSGEYSLSSVRPFVPNPVSLLEITDISIDERIMGMYYLDFTPIKDLKLRLNAGFDRKFRKRSTYLPKSTLYGKNANGEASINQYDNRDYLIETTATYDKEFSEKHRLNLLAGYSYQMFTKEGLNAANKNFITDAFLYNHLGAGQFAKPIVGSFNEISSIISYFGRLNYSLLDRYLLTATLRADGASNLAEGHRWGYFPSVALAWRFSDEPFMEQYKNIISNGKLRLSYGHTGNSQIGNGALNYYIVSSEVVFDESAQRGVQIGQIGNRSLRWETTKEWNIGLDVGLWRRINLIAEVYNRNIVDLLHPRDLMSYYPIRSVAGNVGTTQSKGFELTINTQNLATKNFDWSTLITFSKNKDTWKERPDSWKQASYENVNDPIRAIYGYSTNGIIQPGESVPHMHGALAGMIKMLDVNGFQRDMNNEIIYDNNGMPIKTGEPDGRLDDADMVYLGTWDPASAFGFANNFRYKNWDANIYLYGIIDKLMPATYIDNGVWGATMITQDMNAPEAIKDMFRHDNLTSNIPGYTQMTNQYGAGDFFLTRTWFVRVRNISLGYNFKINKVISNLRVYADVNNPVVFTNYKGLDPETDNSDVAYPNVRTFSFGIDVTF